MLYLAHLDHDLAVDVDGPWRQLWPLRPGLLFVDSDASRSSVYHALKRQAPAGTALLVAELTEPPKFKGMAPGSLAWVRARFGSGDPGR